MIHRLFISSLIVVVVSCAGCAKLILPTDQLSPRHPVINEIMMNPGAGDWGPYEWLELFNPAQVAISLKDYALVYNTQHFTFPDIFLPAQQYLIVTATANEQALIPFGNVCGIAGWPVMSNAGATIGLVHHHLGTVDEVAYTNQWYQTVAKRAGGWSLERINPNLACNPMQSWAESIAERGATPGRQNSRYDADAVPTIQVIDADIAPAIITFRTNIAIDDLFFIQQVQLSPDLEAIAWWDVRADTIEVVLNHPLVSGEPYAVTFEGQFCGQPLTMSYPLFLDTALVYNDVVINEVLFNPYPGSPSFVELYNRSEKIINLQGWLLGNRVLTNDQLLLSPKSFQLITTNPQALLPHYPNAILSDVLVLPSLPSYANQQGIVTLFSTTGLMDSLHYMATMHQPFLRHVQGVSLERISPFSPTNEPGNFTSASTYSDGATPGYENSRIRAGTITKNNVWIQQPLIDPKSMGPNQELRIQYEFIHENTMVNLHIYDSRGRLINRLVRNRGVGYTGVFSWNGKRENGTSAAPGIHIMWMEIYHDTGMRETFKESFVLK